MPLLLLVFWHVATTLKWTMLIPTPFQVAEYMVDFAKGGIYDDAYSATLLTHLLASMSRVYGGFFLADVVGLGKTIVATRIAKKFFYHNGFPNHRSRILVIPPPALKENWVSSKAGWDNSKAALDRSMLKPIAR